MAVRDRPSIGCGVARLQNRAGGRQDGTMIAMSPQRFDELVEAAFDRLPDELTAMLDNVVLFVEDEAPADDPDLLGLYDGTPLTERDSQYAGVLPDRILVFRNPTLRMCETEEEVVAEVAITVAHEIAHHFGIEDDRLHDLGYA
jgi:predicted Zn-dependent protease with MMP-like domain